MSLLKTDDIVRKKIKPQGFTIIEFMVALAVGLIFLGGLASVYIQIDKTTKISNARIDAYQNARAALDFLSDEIKEARPNFFILVNNDASRGDRIDNDNDGRTDEELSDGLDNDGDWVRGRDDRDYTFSNGASEYGYGVPDLGDARIDEDVRYSRDELTIRVASPIGAGYEINYEIGSFQGENNVLVRTIDSSPPTIAPISFDVLSFSILVWDNDPLNPGWITELDGNAPSTVYVSLTVQPDYPDLEPITLHSIINLELVLNP